MSTNPQDTIVAIATAHGAGAVGIVRLSGSQAIEIASRHIVLNTPLGVLESHQLRRGFLLLSGQEADEVLVFVGRRPNSYTGEDTVEFHCHGNPVLLGQLVQSLEGAGARVAEPGEFTKRAFLNGKMDLAQAEAVADLVSATTDHGLRSAFFQLRGGLRSRFKALVSQLRQTKALIEADLDFSEDVSIDSGVIQRQLAEAVALLESQIKSYQTGKLIRTGCRVTLCGKPNVGKSSLMNALLGQDRAIVAESSGTTRDTIEESIEIGGVRVVLTDTAGLRETGDPVELEGTRRSSIAVAGSDTVLLVMDGSQDPNEEDLKLLRTMREAVVILNKADLGIAESWDVSSRDASPIALSALTGQNLDILRDRIQTEMLGSHEIGYEAITNERHVIALDRARAALKMASDAVSRGEPGEVVSFEIDGGLTALADVVGETTAQDILDTIFGQFCIGK